jgi:secreted trypsin-like serine protease
MMLRFSKDLLVFISSFLITACHCRPVIFVEDDDKNIESRIVGGSNALPGEFPFFVQWSGCGASLIHEDIILSAAHVRKIASLNLSSWYAGGSQIFIIFYSVLQLI